MNFIIALLLVTIAGIVYAALVNLINACFAQMVNPIVRTVEVGFAVVVILGCSYLFLGAEDTAKLFAMFAVVGSLTGLGTLIRERFFESRQEGRGRELKKEAAKRGR